MARFISTGGYTKSSGLNPYTSQSSYAQYLLGQQGDAEDLEFRKIEMAWYNGEISDEEYLSAIQKRLSSPLSPSKDLTLKDKLRDVSYRVDDKRVDIGAQDGGLDGILYAIDYYKKRLGGLDKGNINYDIMANKIEGLESQKRTWQRKVAFTDITERGGSLQEKYDVIKGIYDDAVAAGDIQDQYTYYNQLLSLSNQIDRQNASAYESSARASRTELTNQIRDLKQKIQEEENGYNNARTPNYETALRYNIDLNNLYEQAIEQGYDESGAYADAQSDLVFNKINNPVYNSKAMEPWKWAVVENPSTGGYTYKEKTPIYDNQNNIIGYEFNLDENNDKYAQAPDGKYYKIEPRAYVNDKGQTVTPFWNNLLMKWMDSETNKEIDTQDQVPQQIDVPGLGTFGVNTVNGKVSTLSTVDPNTGQTVNIGQDKTGNFGIIRTREESANAANFVTNTANEFKKNRIATEGVPNQTGEVNLNEPNSMFNNPLPENYVNEPNKQGGGQGIFGEGVFNWLNDFFGNMSSGLGNVGDTISGIFGGNKNQPTNTAISSTKLADISGGRGLGMGLPTNNRIGMWEPNTSASGIINQRISDIAAQKAAQEAALKAAQEAQARAAEFARQQAERQHLQASLPSLLPALPTNLGNRISNRINSPTSTPTTPPGPSLWNRVTQSTPTKSVGSITSSQPKKTGNVGFDLGKTVGNLFGGIGKLFGW